MDEWVKVDLHEVEKVTWDVGLVRAGVGKVPECFLKGTQDPHVTEAYDPNTMLGALDRVRIAEGYVLDYVYAFDGHGGEPFLYSRPVDQKPLATFDEFSRHTGWEGPDMLLGDEPTPESSRPYLQHLSFSNDSAGYLQFAHFVMLARRFYLCWHSDYNERIFLPTRMAIERVISERVSWWKQIDQLMLDEIDPTPMVALGPDRGVVKLFNYGDDRGFTFLNIDLRQPNELVGLEDEVILAPRVARFF